MRSFKEQQEQSEKQYQKKINNKRVNAGELKNQRITRRMKKMILKALPFSQNQEQQKCAICLSQCGKSSATLPCSHQFCMGCLSNWWVTNSTCPYCRQNFQYILDYKGRKLKFAQIPKSDLMKRQETLNCEACWADIGEDPMRICYECRCVYMHKRCLNGEQLKLKKWKCEQCIQFEQQEIIRMEQSREKQEKSYHPGISIKQNLSQRHSQRLMFSQVMQKLN